MASSSSSSSSQKEYEYDVFLSFRGEDTRRGFTAHLYDAFDKNNIRTFMDDKKAETGYKISPQLRKAIMGTKIWIIVFSKDFASSTWCLEEVVQILECNRNKNGEIKGNVIPIFYGIKPTIVRKQEESYATAFAKHAERFKDRIEMVQQWRDALNEVSGVTGHDSENFRYDHELIDKIVNDVLLKLPKDQLTIDHFKKNLIGIEERVKDIESFLCNDSEDDVCIIGIWGMGGIGKTTLACTVFDINKSFFDASYILKNIREESKRQGKEHLRKELFCGLLKDECILRKENPSEMSTFIQKWLGEKKVIVVLDDMDEILSLKYFLEGHDQFGTGSRIIVTTRDVQLLRSVTDKIYEVKGLDYSKAHKLFHKHAFERQISIAADFEALSERAIARANGNPLALKVLGSFLCSKSKQEWKSSLDKQEIDPHKEILQVLKISYDSLSRGTQDMFLDFACFITGEVSREEVENTFSCSDHYDVTIEITALIDKSLLTESPHRRGHLSMHDLLSEMGQAIVCDESKIPGNRSRLWTAKDVLHVLEKNKGTDAIQGILLNLYDHDIKKNVQVSPIVFSNMSHLRYLKIYGGKQYANGFWPFTRYHIYAPEGLLDISDELRYFHWDAYPLKYLPNFSSENLVGLIMRGSKLEKLWNEVQHVDLEKLKNIDLSHSERLTEIPNLSGAINLETIKLQGCKSLVQVALNFQNHPKLRILDLSECDNLEECRDSENVASNNTTFIEEETSLSVSIVLKISCCKRLRSIPERIGKLKYQQRLDLSECPNLEKFPEISYGCMERLPELSLKGTWIEELPESIENIKKLERLSLNNCKRLKSLPQSIWKLKYLQRLSVCYCPNLQGKFPEIRDVMQYMYEIDLQETGIEELSESIENLTGLQILNLGRCTQIKFLPNSLRKLSSLKRLGLQECSSLEELPRLPLGLTELDICNCESLKSIRQIPFSLWVLDATGCTSMKTISICESAHIHGRQYVALLHQTMLWSFQNCLDLDHNIRNHIIADTVHKRICGVARSLGHIVVYPGDEIPKWFNNASSDAGNSFNFWFPLNGFKFIGMQGLEQVPFVVCVVCVLNNFDDDNHDKRLTEVSFEYKIELKINTIDGHLHEYIGDCETCLQAGTHNTDHVIIMHHEEMRLEGRPLGQLIGLQSSFSICVKEYDDVNLDIKKCGIHFFCDYNEANVDRTCGDCSDQPSGCQNDLYPQFSPKRIKLTGQDASSQ